MEEPLPARQNNRSQNKADVEPHCTLVIAQSLFDKEYSIMSDDFTCRTGYPILLLVLTLDADLDIGEKI